tara:strand:+ start:387 stop:1199 length:813 start_codon:yes stop_codon:yes gene_type:complete
MPVKIGERVYYKIGDGTIKTGIYENPKGKGRGRVKLAGGKFAMPPKSALHHTRKGAMSEVFAGDKSNKDPILGAKPGPAAAKAKAKNKKEKATPKKTPTKGTQKRSKMFPVSTTSSPDGNKVLLQNVMGIMADVGKDKGKSTQKEKDVNLTMDKQARKGTLKNFKNFDGYLFGDNDFVDEMRDREENVGESYSWGSDFYRLVKRVTKRRNVDSFDDLTESQQEQYQELVRDQSMKDHTSYMKGIFDEKIKGKKFSSLKEAKQVFLKEYRS